MVSILENRAFRHKRLIVCCDGTWEDGTSSEINSPVTNITRICRAINGYAKVVIEGVPTLVPQITYYQKGVGTGVLDRYIGGMSGAGLSANVRAAYAFLAENFDEGDQIYFFGFSRGAYTARAVAGLVADMGLLTNRGMDNFSIVYNDYYKNKKLGYDAETRARLGFRPPLPRFTIQVIGVFDTVGFHDFHLTARLFGEKFELPNTILSPDVRYAFHALSLDERRGAFSPTLWHSPQKVPDQQLLQVWFSGAHGDIGGGEEDPRLSNIALAWMIHHCTKNNQLDFNLDYFFPDPAPAMEDAIIPWATSLGQEDYWHFTQYMEALFFGMKNRTPLAYLDGNEQIGYTNEWIHESVKDRKINKFDKATVPFRFWPSKVLARRLDSNAWELKDGNQIHEVKAAELELFLKGRIRTVRALQVDLA
ncbi:hypothetical protein BGW36DRAFT_393809 [Talaromyces proteolyticus]|uniref:T6SS Phospholipase effector Tle1-like catalytic domain-containing protein n=1 Tax=Talaromyces proteolyticus TaxID=1131652 RepID=A0AAD4L0X7_9EURO|nr:uncharacterized protein BGW36DRAFT_393809 [Talaromyces proteolyticus]KAH8703485.1 hypothetical protein BGW36DRAFT_393809 [Talaromyces proteolyticus]